MVTGNIGPRILAVDPSRFARTEEELPPCGQVGRPKSLSYRSPNTNQPCPADGFGIKDEKELLQAKWVALNMALDSGEFGPTQ